MRGFVRFYLRVFLIVIAAAVATGLAFGFEYGFSVFSRTDLRDWFLFLLISLPLLALIVTIAHYLDPAEKKG